MRCGVDAIAKGCPWRCLLAAGRVGTERQQTGHTIKAPDRNPRVEEILMQLENSFEVPGPPQAAWELLLDIPRVVPCMPGAELVAQLDDTTWKARVQVKLGPIGLTFDSDVRLTEVDEGNRRVTMETDAREARGRGRARAVIRSELSETAAGTRVDITTELSLAGSVAQYGRGFVQDLSSQLIESFAECLKAQLAVSPGEAATAVTHTPSVPISGLSLALRAFKRSVAGFVRRRVRPGATV
jgi:uncharacterized protein